MNTGIFGGTFDPVHMGHIAAARAFFEGAGLDRLIILPNRIPPLKDPAASGAEDRRAMLRIAFSGMKNVTVDDMELEREGTSYTWRTVAELKKMFPQDKLFLLIGDDNLLIFTKWQNFEYILKNCTVCVAPRTGADVSGIIEGFSRDYGASVIVLDYPVIEVSSTELRNGKKAELLPDGVGEYIREKGLYK